MALSKVIKQTSLDNFNVAYRGPQTYLVATGAYTIFTIVGGPVMIVALGGNETTAATGATTIRYTVCGVNVDAGAIAINGAVGWPNVSCLNVAGTLVNAAGIPLTDALLHSKGFIASTNTGAIIATFAVGTDWIGEFFCVYRKLSPNSRII
jgi:hypothetical protein